MIARLNACSTRRMRTDQRRSHTGEGQVDHAGAVVKPDLDLRSERRARIVAAIATALRAAIPGSDVALRGSLATGAADEFSDIDLRWEVPVDDVEMAVAAVPNALSGVAPVVSIRADPDLPDWAHNRLLFVRLAGLPLFWRVDLEVQASFADPAEVTDPTPATAEWSSAASALANAVAVIKAVLRGQFDFARGLLERGFERIGATYHPQESWLSSVVRLTNAAADSDPYVADVAAEVEALAVGLLAD